MACPAEPGATLPGSPYGFKFQLLCCAQVDAAGLGGQVDAQTRLGNQGEQSLVQNEVGDGVVKYVAARKTSGQIP